MDTQPIEGSPQIREGIIDDADRFGTFVETMDADGYVTGRRETIAFAKDNPFAETPAVINVDLGDGVIRERPTAGLEKRVTKVDNEIECTHAVEYWLGDRLVHRSADVKMKKACVLGVGIAAPLTE